MPDEPPARDPQDPLDPSAPGEEASAKKPTFRERADAISERADTAKRAVEARAEVLRARHASVRLAYQAYERDRRQAGALLAGGIAYRLFLWLLPTALLAVGIVGLLADISSTSPESVAHDAGFGAALALTVGQAAQQSGKGSIYLVLLGGVLALWAGRAAVKALMLTASVAWGMRPVSLTRGLVRSLTFSGICVGLMLLPGLLKVLHRGPIGVDLLVELVTVAGMVALSVWMQSFLPHAEGATWTAFLPGAIVLAIGTDLLRLVTQVYLAGRLGRVDDLYGALGVAAVFMAWLYLVARLLVASLAVSAARWRSQETDPAGSEAG
jgi:membrane protein